MNDNIKMNSGYISRYLNHTSLRGYHMLFSGRYIYVALTKSIAFELIKYLKKTERIELFDDNADFVCLNCNGNFIVNGQICNCYKNLDNHCNYLFAVKTSLFEDIEEIFKLLKTKVKFKKLRKNRKKSEDEALGSFNKHEIIKLYEIQSELCYYCMEELNNNYEIDHIVPLFSGGSNWPINLALACKKCNLKKSWTSESYFLKKVRATNSDIFRSKHISFLAKVRAKKRQEFKNNQ